MGQHHLQVFGWAVQQLGGALECPRVGQAVKSVPTDPVPLPPRPGNRICRGRDGQPLMEHGVQARHLRNVGQPVHGGPDRGQRRRHVQRRDVRRLVQCGQHLVGDLLVAGGRGPPCTIRWPTASTSLCC